MFCLELAFCDVLEVLHASDDRGLKARYRLREWMLQLAVALQAVHAKGIAHRDIKPENLLLCTRHKASLRSALPEDGSTPIFNKPNIGPPINDMDSLARSILSDLEVGHPGMLLAAKNGDERAVEAALLALPELHARYKKHAVQDMLGDDIHSMRPILKLCDFGYASMVREGDTVPVGYSPVGSMRYAAPEVYMRHLIFTEEFEFIKLWGRDRLASLQLEPYDSRRIDVWSFGVTLYVLVFGAMPFRAACVNDRRFRAFVRESDPDAIALEVCAPSSEYWGPAYDQRPWKWPKGATAALKHLLQQCMRVDPEKRWTFDRIRKHAWFGNPDWVPPLPKQSGGTAAAGKHGQQSTAAPPALSGAGAASPHQPHKHSVHFDRGVRPAPNGSEDSPKRFSGPPPDKGLLTRHLTGGTSVPAFTGAVSNSELLEGLGIAPMHWLEEMPTPLASFDRDSAVPKLPFEPCEPAGSDTFVRKACSSSYDALLHSVTTRCTIVGAL